MAICLFLSVARIGATAHSGRYAGHTDEQFLFHRATLVLGGDLNPHFFRYPSLPIYLTAGAMKASLAVAPPKSRQDGSLISWKIPREKGMPYDPPRPMQHARLAFSLLAVGLYFSVAWLAAQVAGGWTYAWLAPLLLGLSSLVQRQAVVYQNVDLPATFFSTAALAVALSSWQKSSLWLRAVVPGALVGCAVASKYNSGIVLVSCALALVLDRSLRNRGVGLAALGASAALFFFISVPYSILDFEQFRADVLFEINHYKNGHPGFEEEPGWPQLKYYLTHFYEAYGKVVCALALIGVTWGLWARRIQSAIALSFPVLMLLHMSTNRTHFLRTVLPVFALIPVFAAVGVQGLFALALMANEKWGAASKRKWVAVGASLTLAVGVLWTLVAHPEGERLFDRNIAPDTRDQAARFLTARHEPGVAYAVSRDLWLPKEDLPGDNSHYVGRDSKDTLASIAKLGSAGYLLVPEYGKPQRVPSRYRRSKKKKAQYKKRGQVAAKKARKDQERLVRELGAEKVWEVDGKKAPLEKHQGRALPTDNPRITVYRFSRRD